MCNQNKKIDILRIKRVFYNLIKNKRKNILLLDIEPEKLHKVVKITPEKEKNKKEYIHIVITKVIQVQLKQASGIFFKGLGFKHPEDFIKHWQKTKSNYEPEEFVWAYWFKLVE